MKSFAIFITVCVGLAAARSVKRQATPPVPTLPPMKTDMMTSGAPMGTNPTTQPPPPPSSTAMMTNPPQQPSDTTDGGAAVTTPMMPVDTSTASTMAPNPPSTQPPTVTPGQPDTTTTMDIQTTQPTTPGTTKKPTIDELVSVDEILEVFGNVAKSDFFKTLPFEDQLLVMEILAGGETGKMTAVLESVELKHLLRFMYNIPFKYADPLWRVIFLGYTREEILAA